MDTKFVIFWNVLGGYEIVNRNGDEVTVEEMQSDEYRELDRQADNAMFQRDKSWALAQD